MATRRFLTGFLGFLSIALGVCVVEGATNRKPMALRVLDDGTTMVAGAEDNTISNVTALFVRRLSVSGLVLSDVRVPQPFAIRDVAIHSDGTVVVACNTMANKGDFYLMKYYGGNGAKWWWLPVTYNGSGNGPDSVSSVAFDAQGNVFVSGVSR